MTDHREGDMLRGMWKTALIAVLVVLAIVGGLFATGIVSLERRGEDTAKAEDAKAGPKAEAKKNEDNLRSLAYVGAMPQRPEDEGKKGVVFHDADKASPGLNLVTPCGWGKEYAKLGLKDPLRVTRLMDMEGKVLHEWTHQYPNIVPGKGWRGRRGWANGKLGPDGHLYVVHARTGFLKLDWDSNLLWGRDEFYHHDFDFLPDGTVVALVEDMRTIEFEGESVDILDNGLAFISPDGELKKTMWFYDLLKDEAFFIETLQQRIARDKKRNKRRGKSSDMVDDAEDPEDEDPGDEDDETPSEAPAKDEKSAAPVGKDASAKKGAPAKSDATAKEGKKGAPEVAAVDPHKKKLGGKDLFHANSVEILPADVKGRWKKGDIMTSFREMDIIAVFDPKTGALRWHWGKGQLDHQHDPSLLPDGTVLLFDNGMRRKKSRILKVDPIAEKIVWKWEGMKGDRFFSYMRGQVQPLENGNMLVVESERGRVFELDTQGEIVWDYFTTDQHKKHVISLRMNRVQGPALKALEAKLAESQVTAKQDEP